MSTIPSPLLDRIEHPDFFNAHLKILEAPVLKVGRGVVRGHDLDTDQRRCREHGSSFAIERNDHDIGHPESRWPDLNTLLRRHADHPFVTPGMKVGDQDGL
ncbi:MAG: hypothetical protein WB676_09395 [Bryobacteraceae bacterium]